MQQVSQAILHHWLPAMAELDVESDARRNENASISVKETGRDGNDMSYFYKAKVFAYHLKVPWCTGPTVKR